MDLLRAAIKALYYDYPIENAYGMIVGKDSSKNFLEHFNRLACGEDDGFSTREMTAYKDYLEDAIKEKLGQRENKIQQFVGLPLLFSEEVLTKNNFEQPCVKFRNLFRWREVVKCLGEDLFTTAYLAQHDTAARTDYFWPNVIGHNEEKVNAALDTGLSDIHAHFGGSIDSFQFNWICLMNDIEGLKDKFEKLQYSYNDVVVFDKEYAFKDMSKWCRVAAAIRVRLYKLLIKGQKLNAIREKEEIWEIGNCSGDDEATGLKEDIDSLRMDGKRTREGMVLDYAITEALVSEPFVASPYCIYAGERQIEYAFFKDYQRKKPTVLKGTWVELFYLYELIKIHLRREFVIANEISGLDNFIGFTTRTALFTEQIQPVCNQSSIQTSIRADKDDYIESRITYGSWSLPKGKYWKGLFADEQFLEEEEMKKRLTLVVQLTRGWKQKGEHKEGRHHQKRDKIHEEYQQITRYISDNESEYDIVGIDVGGMELYYRPEVYAHVLRAGKKQQLNVTYHVGEEFYDLADGLRAIWEIIQYAGISEGDRLGHCLALGVLPREYYKRKHCTLTMPKQVMLDNIVWLLGMAQRHHILMKPGLKSALEEKAGALFEELGYKRYAATLCIDDYFDSMLLRSDEANEEDGMDVWSLTAELDTEDARQARVNGQALKLLEAYMLDERVIENGEKPTTERFDNEYVKLMMKVQKVMIEEVKKTGVCIETCPSSNLQIGKLGRYDSHPGIKYYLNPLSKNKVLKMAVCTDDKGTFSTSLTNEFSLLALAATKEKGWNKGIERDFAQLISQGNKYRFKKIESYED